MTWKMPADQYQTSHSGPPHLDEMFKKWYQKLRGVRSTGPAQAKYKFSWLIAVLMLLALWGISGIYTVSEGGSSVVTLFKQYQKTTGPGVQWYARFFQNHYEFNANTIVNHDVLSNAYTKDQAVANLGISINYQVTNPQAYLFNSSNTNDEINHLAGVATQTVIGNMTLADMLGDNSAMASNIAVQLKILLANDKLGISLNGISINSVHLPGVDANILNSINNARSANQTLVDQAQSQVNSQVQAAQAKITQQLQDEKQTSAQSLVDAGKNVATFMAILPQYKKDPEATKEYLYLNTMKEIYTHAKVVLQDGQPINISMAAGNKSDNTAPAILSQTSNANQPQKNYLRWQEAEENAN